ncbi:MAG: acyl-CoA dehydrogenase family protein [Planctomycetota bacterium]|jgi:alkylation response protein AidB-like acyl-CoA dehydrogenase
MRETKGLDKETLDMILGTFRELAARKMPLEKKLEWDRKSEFPEDLIREMIGEEVGLHLTFLPEEAGGLGGGARDITKLCEEMAKVDLGVASAFLSISLGTDPIFVGGTPEQKKKWLAKIAEGRIVAYAVTEPEAGSNLAALKTKAEPIEENGKVTAYRINGTKQFITNGGVADIYTLLANAPGGATFFIAEKGTKGLNPGDHEDKHGIRCSNTAPIVFEDMILPAENLLGGEEGKGLKQATQVFGYTRLMVAALGLGGGCAAIEKAAAYAKDRRQFGKLLIDLQGYTHKLLVPHVVRMEAARAYIDEIAERLDRGSEGSLEVEGSIAKLFATEAGDHAADDAIQALGGYGYMREYEVEKIKRDIKITCIYEGTSEIQQNIIGLFRQRTALRGGGKFYGDIVSELEGLSGETGGPRLAGAVRLMNEVLRFARETRVNRQQHIMFTLSDMITHAEVGGALCRKAAKGDARLKAAARLFAAEAAEVVLRGAAEVCCGTGVDKDGKMAGRIRGIDAVALRAGAVADMDLIAADLAK